MKQLSLFLVSVSVLRAFLKSLAIVVLAAPVLLAHSASSRDPVRVSAWYWLNAAPRSEWAADFHHMQRLGFTDISLCWGLDSAAWRFRVDDTKYALDLAAEAGLGVYLIVWHPTHNSLPRKPQFQQMDAGGNFRFTFDTFNATWRNTQWKQYLQTIANLYAKQPAFAGYIFDDTFGMGGIGAIDGGPGTPQQQYVSYNDFDVKAFGRQPPKSPSDPAWQDWTAARSKWWVEWSSDTMRFIREVDHNPSHEIYVEDSVNTVFGSQVRDRVGLDFGKAAGPWDAVGLYTEPAWDASPDSGRKQAEMTRKILAKTRAEIGSKKEIIYTFWSGNSSELRTAGPAKFPTVAQIRELCEAALSVGIRHLDMYGYRIGDYLVTAQNWPQKRPPESGPYPVTGQFPKKYLNDRTELHEELGSYLRSLRTR
jgi:hypothetical protein